MGKDGRLKLEPNGQCTWSGGLGSFASDSVRAIAVDPSGDIAVTGSHGGPVLGKAISLGHKGGEGLFVLRLASSGDIELATTFGSDKNDVGTAVKFLPNTSDLLVGGEFEGWRRSRRCRFRRTGSTGSSCG